MADGNIGVIVPIGLDGAGECMTQFLAWQGSDDATAKQMIPNYEGPMIYGKRPKRAETLHVWSYGGSHVAHTRKLPWYD